MGLAPEKSCSAGLSIGPQTTIQLGAAQQRPSVFAQDSIPRALVLRKGGRNNHRALATCFVHLQSLNDVCTITIFFIPNEISFILFKYFQQFLSNSRSNSAWDHIKPQLLESSFSFRYFPSILSTSRSPA